MQATFQSVVETLKQSDKPDVWQGIKRGIEREALRINENGTLATTDHPRELGRTLTHPTITTDYSENLLEFITPVATDINTTLKQLRDIHRVTYNAIGEELLWPMSMPCYLGSDKDIRIAKYGDSHSGRMKSLYRRGLTYRYGATMQVIAGVHYNFSVSDDMWEQLAQVDGEVNDSAYRSKRYFGLIRNFKRLAWVIPYLFGASPALCKSFFTQTNNEELLKKWDFDTVGKGTVFLPYGTSLRMSDLGYTNKEQATLKITYNSLEEYVAGLRKAITTQSQQFSKIGVKVDDDYRQLNDNILQIENEFYSPIRPKQIAQDGETPSQALERGGVEYIEIRALDVNPYSDVGITAQQMRFLDLLLLYCLLQPSEEMTWEQQQQADKNFTKVVMEGRNPRLSLAQNGIDRLMADWLEELFADLSILAKTLDNSADTKDYQNDLADLYEWVLNPERTLSGQIMHQLQSENWDNSRIGMLLAKKYRQEMTDSALEFYDKSDFSEWAQASEKAFSDRYEQDNTVDFDTFLANYFENAKQPG
ncbi:glutamate--cysteine ligase [Idiomarina zobellii]|uniref:Glutamate--cysteine ligase n=1 Tax=Idiomarina zobellii TaxID=86103 RepID=A0A837NKI9_9GAMM|nr:glutamate--cysteine ligase [Idiomarina zobellii]KPD25029.1 glutamate--cysteine ligase [Idiomarina zobellii]SDF35978.1 glutamate-cysteine ligase [Idiomarina zobellii]